MKITEKINVSFIEEVQEFNKKMGKTNNIQPTIPFLSDSDFAFSLIKEELKETETACINSDIIEVADGLADLMYVLCNAILLFGLKDKFSLIYAEVQASNLSKVCKSEEEAIQTIELRSKEQNTPCHYDKVGDNFIVYRTWDGKVMKSINYFKPNLAQFFTETELSNLKK